MRPGSFHRVARRNLTRSCPPVRMLAGAAEALGWVDDFDGRIVRVQKEGAPLSKVALMRICVSPTCLLKLSESKASVSGETLPFGRNLGPVIGGEKRDFARADSRLPNPFLARLPISSSLPILCISLVLSLFFLVIDQASFLFFFFFFDTFVPHR
jgi:hypothetical protein